VFFAEKNGFENSDFSPLNLFQPLTSHPSPSLYKKKGRKRRETPAISPIFCKNWESGRTAVYTPLIYVFQKKQKSVSRKKF